MRRTVGSSIRKIDAEDKLRGRSRYAADYSASGMLWVKVLRSRVPRARIEGIDAGPALDISGVKGVYTARDIPGSNRVGPRIKDELLLCEDEIHAVGDPIAVVAADSKEAAEEAAEHVAIRLRELVPVLTIEEAMDSNAPEIHEGGNLVKVRSIVSGHAEKALESADIVISKTYRTQMIEHAYMEPEAALAAYEDGKLTVWMPSKYINADHVELASILDLGLEDLRLVLSTVGGYFGGKSGISPAFYCALVTHLTGKPSKMVYTREESFISSTKRHPYIIEHTLGAGNDGRLVAAKVRILADAGAYTGFSPSVLSRSAVHAVGPYSVPNISVDAFLVYTNNINAGAMRGFGVPQTAFAHEAQMDFLAASLGMDSAAVRKLNFLKEGSRTITGQRLEHSVGLEKTCDEVVRLIRKDERGSVRNDERYLYGWGLASMFYGIGSTGIPNPAKVTLECRKDGTVGLLAGITDGGQGAATALSQIVAERLGIPVGKIRFTQPATDVTPDSGTSTASRLTYVVGRALYEAGSALRKEWKNCAARLLGCPAETVRFDDGHFYAEGGTGKLALSDLLERAQREGLTFRTEGYFDPDTTGLDPDSGYGSPYGTYAFATQAALVRVDRGTGQVEVLRVVAAHDVGRAVNPNTIEAQVQGGVTMGVGYGIMEQVIREHGTIQNPGFHGYLLPTAMDIPDIETIIVEDPEPTGPYGAKGLGEPVLIPTAPAIRNAVSRATGCEFFELPLTAEKVWRGINKSSCWGAQDSEK